MNGRRRALVAVGAAAIAACVGGVLIAAVAVGATDDATSDRRDPTVAAAPAASANPFAAGGLQDPSIAPPVADVGTPTTIRIPSIGVQAGLEDLAVGANGALDAPVDFDRAGWYSAGPAPGEIGPAIIAGHVDSATGPAVFVRLSELKDGDEILVDTDTGATLTFTVTGRLQSAKATFPTADVYDNVPRPELRLITCAGFFDGSVGHYTDNLIVFASLAP